MGQASASTLRQLRDDVNDSILIENNEVTPEWCYNPIFKQLHCFQWEQNCYHHHSVDADARCKWARRCVHIRCQINSYNRSSSSWVNRRCDWTIKVYSHLKFIKHELAWTFQSAQSQKWVHNPLMNFLVKTKSWPNSTCECAWLVQYNLICSEQFKQ